MSRRNSIQATVERLVERHGFAAEFKAALKTGTPFHLRVEHNSDAMLPLVVEVLPGDDGSPQISLTHYRESWGDLIQDPEIVFDSNYVGRMFQMPNVYQRVPDGYRSPSLDSFAKTWAMNIRHQGYCDPERVTTLSVTHPR